MGLTQQQQRWAADDLVLQKMRADLEAVYNSLPSGAGFGPGGGGFGPGSRRLSAGVQRVLVHPLASRVPVMKALLATGMLALSVGQAVAVCVSHSPYDPRCTVQDMLDPSAASPQFYMQNPASAGHDDLAVYGAGLRPGGQTAVELVRGGIRGAALRQWRAVWAGGYP